jgi:putative oxidoreductase
MNVNVAGRNAGWGLTVLRVVVGIVFIMHGYQKLFVWGFDGVEQGFAGMGIPLPGISAIVVSLVEFFCGLALLLGLFTRLAAIPPAIVMIVAITMVHLKNGFYNPQGVEFPLTLLAALVCLMLAGPGEAALDNALARRRGPAS